MRQTALSTIIIMAAVIFLGSCPNPENGEPTLYERIVIDTFSPDGVNFVDTYIELFDAAGDPDPGDNPWTEDAGDALASDDNGNTDPGQTFMSRIDYTDGLLSGTYYIRVRADVEDTAGWYAIRALSLVLGDSLPAYDLPGLPANQPDDYEDDDDQDNNWVMIEPVPTIQLGNANRLNRSIDYDGVNLKGDVDWFKLVLD